MSLYNGPPRGGARGGKDQFNWDSVKSDKDREFYLGHSVKASVGRWQKGRDILWYTREKKDDADAAMRTELSMVKQREEELMLEALGMKPKTIRAKSQPQLDTREMKQLMEGDDEEQEETAEPTDTDAVKGLGYSSGQIIGAGEAAREQLAGTGMGRALPQDQVKTIAVVPHLPLPPHISAADLKKVRKAQKHNLKQLKRAAKKQAKKEAKKEAKKVMKAEKRSKNEKRKQVQASSSGSESGSEASQSPPKTKTLKPEHLEPAVAVKRQDSRHENHAVKDGSRGSNHHLDVRERQWEPRRSSPHRHRRSPSPGRGRNRFSSRSPPRRSFMRRNASRSVSRERSPRARRAER